MCPLMADPVFQICINFHFVYSSQNTRYKVKKMKDGRLAFTSGMMDNFLRGETWP